MWIESSDVETNGRGNGHEDSGAVAPAARAGVFGEPFFLWTSIIALGSICRARRDQACLKTAAKLALAVSATSAVARTSRVFSGGAAGRDFFAGHRAAAWAAAGVIRRDQGRGVALTAYTAAALSSSRRREARTGIADLVAGALLGDVMSRLVARL